MVPAGGPYPLRALGGEVASSCVAVTPTSGPMNGWPSGLLSFGRLKDNSPESLAGELST